MSKYKVGLVVKESRRREGLTQNELSSRLDKLEPLTISRLENGVQNTTRENLSHLMGELKPPVTLLNSHAKPVEYIRAQLEAIVKEHIVEGDYEIKELLKDYRSCCDTMDYLEEQFCLYAEALCERRQGMNMSCLLQKYMDALKKTFKGFSFETDLSKHMLSEQETKLIICIADCLYNDERKDVAITVLQSLNSYYHVQEVEIEEYANDYPYMAYLLVTWLNAQKDCNKALSVANEAISCCIRYGKMTYLFELLYEKGFALFSIGNIKDGKVAVAHSFAGLEETGKKDILDLYRRELTVSFGDFVLEGI